MVINGVNSDLADGWAFLNHLHNHNFNMAASEGIVLVGAPIPSLSDIELYKKMELPSASVTNGFNTLDLKSSEFNIFHSR